MGIYTVSQVFYGCPVASNREELKQKFKTIDFTNSTNLSQTESESAISTIKNEKNYVACDNRIFLIVPRTKKSVSCQIDSDDMKLGYVKMSDLNAITQIKEVDILPTADEKELFLKYIKLFTKEDEFDKLIQNAGCMIAEFELCTLDEVPNLTFKKSLLINLDF